MQTADNQKASVLLTAPKAAVALGLSEFRIRQMLKDGQLPCRPVGKRLMVPSVALEKWLTEVGKC